MWDCRFFIHRGELLVVSDDDQVVLSMREGGFFGEIALLYDTKRTVCYVGFPLANSFGGVWVFLF